MMKVTFEENEYLVMAMFEEKSRRKSMEEINLALRYLDKEDDELIDLVKQTILKMKRISDDDYTNIDLKPYRQEVEEEDDGV